MSFPSTRWTLIAKLSDPEEREGALDTLCVDYWAPVYAFLRRSGSGHEEAEDLTQGFFEMVVRNAFFERAERGTGRLRSFLLGILENFTANAERTRTALKRGGGQPLMPLHEAGAAKELAVLAADCATPAEAFDRAWLALILQRAVSDLRRQYEAVGKGRLFTMLLPSLMDGDVAPQDVAAVEAGISVASFRVQLHRLRIRYRDALQRAVAETVDEGADLGEELEYFFSISRRAS